MSVLAKTRGWSRSAAARAGKCSPRPSPGCRGNRMGRPARLGAPAALRDREVSSLRRKMAVGLWAECGPACAWCACSGQKPAFPASGEVAKPLRKRSDCCARVNTKIFNGSRLMCVFRSHSLPLEREILLLRERASRKQPGDSDAAASFVQNQVYRPHHCGRVHEGGLDQPSQGMGRGARGAGPLWQVCEV